MRFLILSLLLTFTALNLQAQPKPVKWDFEVEKISDNEFNLVFSAVAENGWYIYSQFLGSDEGPVPTSFVFEDAKGVEFLGKVEEKGEAIEKYDDMFGMDLKYYKGKVSFQQKVKVANPDTEINGFLEFMTCNGEQCLPPTEVEFALATK